jgi:hypothetical protein
MTVGIRTTFLACCESVRPLLASGSVRERWTEPSALDRMTIGALAGHLMRAVTSVDAYLDREVPSGGDVLDAPGYFLSIEGVSDPDLDSELHSAIRSRAAGEAEAGHEGVLAAWDAAVARLTPRLDGEPTDRLLPALGSRVVTLDEYLVTRLLEMLVHADDLAVSVDTESPAFPPAAEAAVIGCLVEVGRRRHGSVAVIRALARRERDAVQALRVL